MVLRQPNSQLHLSVLPNSTLWGWGSKSLCLNEPPGDFDACWDLRNTQVWEIKRECSGNAHWSCDPAIQRSVGVSSALLSLCCQENIGLSLLIWKNKDTDWTLLLRQPWHPGTDGWNEAQQVPHSAPHFREKPKWITSYSPYRGMCCAISSSKQRRTMARERSRWPEKVKEG